MSNIISAAAEVSATMRYSVRLAEDYPGAYLFVGGLQLAFHGDPETQMASVDRLSLALTELRDAIDRRASEPLPTADDVLGILAESAVS